jgi:hypothetical protein
VEGFEPSRVSRLLVPTNPLVILVSSKKPKIDSDARTNEHALPKVSLSNRLKVVGDLLAGEMVLIVHSRHHNQFVLRLSEYPR